MISLSQALHPEVAVSTFMESCGAADLVASCYGGRNRRVAEAFVRATAEGSPKTFESLEVRHHDCLAPIIGATCKTWWRISTRLQITTSSAKLFVHCLACDLTLA